MVQITVLRVDITCHKNRKKLLQAVSGIQGVDGVEIEVNKGTLAVTGNADPYEIILQAQKVGRFVEVVSVGPLNKKLDEEKLDQKPLAPLQAAQPQVQLQNHAQFPTLAHSHTHEPRLCPVCQPMYMYRWPGW